LGEIIMEESLYDMCYVNETLESLTVLSNEEYLKIEEDKESEEILRDMLKHEITSSSTSEEL
jgi:hypothetical protein